MLAARAFSTYFQASGTSFPQHKWEASSCASSGDGTATPCAASAEETCTAQPEGSQPVPWAALVNSTTSSHGKAMGWPPASNDNNTIAERAYGTRRPSSDGRGRFAGGGRWNDLPLRCLAATVVGRCRIWTSGAGKSGPLPFYAVGSVSESQGVGGG